MAQFKQQWDPTYFSDQHALVVLAGWLKSQLTPRTKLLHSVRNLAAQSLSSLMCSNHACLKTPTHLAATRTIQAATVGGGLPNFVQRREETNQYLATQLE